MGVRVRERVCVCVREREIVRGESQRVRECVREREWVSEGEGERLSEGAGARECGEHQVRERARECVSRLEGV